MSAQVPPSRHGQSVIAMPLLQHTPSAAARAAATYEDALFMYLPARLAKRLLLLAETQELAKMAGVSRESVNKLLRAWQGQGLIAHDHSHVTILDPARLKRLVERA